MKIYKKAGLFLLYGFKVCNQTELQMTEILVSLEIKLKKEVKKIDLPESHINEQCGTEL